jgi:hypothetical protein
MAEADKPFDSHALRATLAGRGEKKEQRNECQSKQF